MDIVIAGGMVRALQGLAAAAPTLIVGLFVASLLRYYLGTQGTVRLFGGDSIRSLPQAWLVGMLLPVCSIGVIPIIREMRRMGVRPGAITAFALSAPLFNPLSLLYGLTLSRPFIIVGFAMGSLVVVTLLGVIWDLKAPAQTVAPAAVSNPIGLRRLGACALFMAREVTGLTGLLTLIAVAGLAVLGMLLPHGALQSSVEQLDPLAPLKMALVAVPVYATPMLAMSQLGMMFEHGNSPGAAFCLLLLGTGVNLATLVWVAINYGRKATFIWFSSLCLIVLGCAYAVDRPLIPPGIKPEGHTHAFDIYTNPFTQGAPVSGPKILDTVGKTIGLADYIGLGIVAFVLLGGVLTRTVLARPADRLLNEVPAETLVDPKVGMNRHVSSRTVGLTCLSGLMAFSIVGCYAFYPAPDESLEEMRLARNLLLSGVSSKDYDGALRWIPIVDDWSRKLEVGYAIRNFELRPYQQMQTYLLRKKLELLEHAIAHANEHAMEDASSMHAEDKLHLEHEIEEMNELRFEISLNASRLRQAFGVSR